MAAFVAKRMGEPDVEFRFKAGELVSWQGSKSDEEHRGTVVDAVYPTRVGARRGRAVYLVHTASEDGDQWCVLVDGDDDIYPLCETLKSDRVAPLLDMLVHLSSCAYCMGAICAIAGALPAEPDAQDSATDSAMPSVHDVFRSLTARLREEEARILRDQLRKLRGGGGSGEKLTDDPA